MKILRLLSVAFTAAFFIASAQAQQGGTVTQYAFAIGKGAGSTSFTSLLCGATQLAVGQSAANPICRTLTGDVTLDAAGVTAIGAAKVTSAMLNSNVYSTAHTWSGQQTFVAPILGTPASGTLSNATGLPISTGVSGLGTGIATALGVNVGTAGSPVINGGVLGTPSSGIATNLTGLPVGTGISGLGTGVATALGVNVGTAGAPVVNGGALGTPSSGTATNITGLPISTGVSGLGTNVAAFLATPSSANLRAALTDEIGTGAAYFVGGALGTPASGTATNLTGLPLSTGVTGTLAATNFPALTGDVTTAAGALATTLATVNANVGSFGGVSAVPNFTVNAKGLVTAAGSAAYQNGTNAQKGVVQGDGTTITCVAGVCTSVGSAATSVAVGTTTITGGSSGDFLYNNGGVLGSRPRTAPTTQTFLSGSGTYTTPANVLWIELVLVGGGGGGSGGSIGNGQGNGGNGGNTCWNTTGAACTTPVFQAGGGTGGVSTNTSPGGTVGGSGTCSVLSVSGGQGSGPPGGSVVGVSAAAGGNGGSSLFGGAGVGGQGVGGSSAATNSGSGGGGGGVNASANSQLGGPGGGSGAGCSTIINSPAATYTYAVGAAGTAGTAGTNGLAGAAGALGRITAIEHYN